ncbi:MAG: hypothetical protein PVI01_09850 [Gemmatimonadales bacterium]|jgi:hypothetical protein
MTLSVGTFFAVLIQYGEVAPLPAESPIGGPLWSVVIPALLLVAASLGTLLLYRHFASQDDDSS